MIDCGGKTLDLTRPRVMGILNVTPDSFSDGGIFFSKRGALEHARRMVDEGASIVDVGGESTRPGAESVSVEVELKRVIPVIGALTSTLPVPVCIDTSKPAVMRAAVAAGAGMINDVRALRAPGALEAAARAGVPVCLMHMRGEPRTMQSAPSYRDVVSEVKRFLEERVAVCEQAGISRQRLLVDPGFGFGKTLEQNLLLLKYLRELTAIGLPVLIGVSRKSMFGALLQRPVGERLYGSLAAAVLAASAGAQLIRAHDVGANVEALKVVAAVMEQQ